VRTGALVTRVTADAVWLGGEQIRTRTVLWAAGVAATPLARTLGVPVDRAGRVIVEGDLSIPGHPEAFAIGDMCVFLHQTGRPLPGVAPVAIQQGRAAAANVLRRLGGRPTRAFRYRDRGSMATIGRAAAVAVIAGRQLSGPVAWLTWLLVHIAFLIGFRNRVLVCSSGPGRTCRGNGAPGSSPAPGAGTTDAGGFALCRELLTRAH
jgi:NADH:ubiquinone reductase (H+-translocating)